MIRIIRWCPAILWMLLIFSFSEQTAIESSALSGGIVDCMMDRAETLYELFFGEVWQFSRETLVFIVRKGAHMFVYWVLAILIHGVWSSKESEHSKSIKTLILCILYAISDECHQGFVPGRSAEFRDVCFDTVGALMGMVSCMLFYHYIKRKKGRI